MSRLLVLGLLTAAIASAIVLIRLSNTEKPVEYKQGYLETLGYTNVSCFAPNRGSVVTGTYKGSQCTGFSKSSPADTIALLKSKLGSVRTEVVGDAICLLGKDRLCVSRNSYPADVKTMVQIF